LQLSSLQVEEIVNRNQGQSLIMVLWRVCMVAGQNIAIAERSMTGNVNKGRAWTKQLNHISLPNSL
jgi:hypothetical protein